MKQPTKNLWLQALPALLVLFVFGVAQQREDSVAMPDLALQVNRGHGRPIEIPAVDGGGAGMSGFTRINSGKVSTGEPPVDQLNLKIGREGPTVIVYLSVTLANGKEVTVAKYRLRQGDTVTTSELAKFDLEPLVLGVIERKPRPKESTLSIQPSVDNKTKVIEVVSFYRDPASDIFRLTVRNVSNKGITALDLFIPSADGNGGQGQRAQGDKEHLVMAPGGTSEQLISLTRGGRRTPSGYVPDPDVQRTLIIRTVIFEDGTYDGLVEPAAEIKAWQKGLNIQRTRALNLFREATTIEDNKRITSLDDFKERVYALDTTAEADFVSDLLGQFPSLKGNGSEWFKENIEDGLREGKRELLRHINDLEAKLKQPQPHFTFPEWLEQTKANYEKLIKRF